MRCFNNQSNIKTPLNIYFLMKKIDRRKILEEEKNYGIEEKKKKEVSR